MDEQLKLKIPSFILSEERFDIPAGTTVYKCTKYDYGVSRDDTFYLGEQCMSISLSPDGDYPFYSVPVRILCPSLSVD